MKRHNPDIDVPAYVVRILHSGKETSKLGPYPSRASANSAAKTILTKLRQQVEGRKSRPYEHRLKPVLDKKAKKTRSGRAPEVGYVYGGGWEARVGVDKSASGGSMKVRANSRFAPKGKSIRAGSTEIVEHKGGRRKQHQSRRSREVPRGHPYGVHKAKASFWVVTRDSFSGSERRRGPYRSAKEAGAVAENVREDGAPDIRAWVVTDREASRDNPKRRQGRK